MDSKDNCFHDGDISEQGSIYLLPYMEKTLYRLVDLYRPLFPPRR